MPRWKAVLFSPTFKYPMFAMVIIVAASAWYYRFASKRSETEVNERSLHVLAALAEELSGRLTALDKISDQGWSANKLRLQVPELQEEHCASDLSLQRKLRVSDGKLHVVMGGKQSKPSVSCWFISVDHLVAQLTNSLPQGAFDDLLVADASGGILYQTRRSGMEIADLHPFFEQALQNESQKERSAETTKETKKPSGHNPIQAEGVRENRELATWLAVSKLTDVDLGGERYKLYTVPVTGPASTDSNPVTFVVAGILHECEFQEERTRPLANVLVTLGFFVLLLAAGAYPILRFRLMGPGEELKQNTGFVFSLQLFISAVLLGGLAGHLMFSRYEEQTDDELHNLSSQVEGNLAAEARDALAMLRSIEQLYEDHHKPVKETKAVSGKTCSDDIDFHEPNGKYDWSSEVLGNVPNPRLYPYFDHAYFADEAGYQEIKFSARSSITPEVRLCDSRTFTHPRSESDLWKFPDAPLEPGFWIEPDYSLTSGRYLAFISRPVSERLRKKAAVAGIGAAMVSVSQPVFPPEYGFAIVDRNGKVLFHSTPAKNGRENFADACDRARRLHGLLEARQSDILETSYLGIRHRVLVQPIRSVRNCPWSVVIFRDLTSPLEDHFDAVLLFLFLLGVYVTLAIILGWWAGYAKRPPAWIWPVEDRQPMYWQIFAVLVLATGFNFWLFRHCDQTQLWVSAYSVPFFAAAFTVLKLKSRNRAILLLSTALWLITAAWTGYEGSWVFQPNAITGPTCVSFWLAFTLFYASFACLALPISRPVTQAGLTNTGVKLGQRVRFPHWSLATVYAWPATALLFTIGFIPSLRLFNASVLFQSIVAARRSQLEVAYQLERRQQRISQTFLGSYGDESSARAKYINQRLDETRDLYYLRSVPSANRNLHVHRLERMLVALSSAVLDHDGSSPSHRSGLRRPYVEWDRSDWKKPGAAWEWCETGPEEGIGPLLVLKVVPPEPDCLDGKGQLDFKKTWIASPLPERVLPIVTLWGDPWVFFETILTLVMIGAAFFALRSAIERMFALNWMHPQMWPHVHISSDLDLRHQCFGQQSLLLGTPCSGKTALLKHSSARYIDLINDPQCEKAYSLSGSDEVIVLDHFEHCLNRPLQRQSVLCALERLTYDAKCRVVIVSNIDPKYYFDQLDNDLDVERWTRVLLPFRVVQATSRRFIEDKQHFALLWRTCSDEERKALYQIAKHGWPNHLQELALTHLFLRCLITHNSRFELADPHFADYIRDSFCEQQFVNSEKNGTDDTLNALRIVLGVGGIAFIAALAYIWGDQAVAYIATGASALTAASRVFSKSKGRENVGAENVYLG